MKRVSSIKEEEQIVIFTANVLQDNRNYGAMLQQIRDTDPDVIFLVETDEQWQRGVGELEKRYSYRLACPLDNTYGLLFFSRLPLRNERVVCRIEDEVPSVETEVQLPSGVWVKIFGLHPKPPVPDESLYSTAKDKELMKVAFQVKEVKGPCIVMGDLNDVAWSHVTELFRKVSSLLDPRRGRGFYSTFSANNWLMRFPLDYIFCSSDFGLVKMKRMPHNGSDHFAMLIHLQYDPRLKIVHDEPHADREEKEEAKEKAVAG
jgi:endonuclease/exonuclease/phosphatase (EEP) superfamily protein YafD